MEATCCWTAAVWKLLVVGLLLCESYVLLDCCGMEATCCWTATVWILVVAELLLYGYYLWLSCCWLLQAYYLLDACWLPLGLCLLDDCWLRLGHCWLYEFEEISLNLPNSRPRFFSFCRELNFLSLCKIKTWKVFGQNLFWQSDVKRRKRFWLWATFRKAGMWEWMMFAALQIGSIMKLCRHTTWPSCSQ